MCFMFHNLNLLLQLIHQFFSELPFTTDIEATATLPRKVLEHRLVKRGKAAIPQVLIQWTGLPLTSITWEDYNVIRQRFP